MRFFLNDNKIEANAPLSLMGLLVHEKIIDKGGIAVAVNNQVIPKSKWKETRLSENDKIIIITATAGG